MPAKSELVTRLALAALSRVPIPITALPSKNVTDPVIDALPDPETVTVNTTFWPYVLGLGAAVSVVVLEALLTTCGTAADEDAKKLLSPA